MTAPLDQPNPPPTWLRRPALIAALSVIAGCAAAIALICLVTDPVVTPQQEQIAAHALVDPSTATLHLGLYGDISEWQSPSSTDFAMVENVLVVFPQIFRNGLQAGIYTPLQDRLMLVLVYAPDGRDMTLRPPPPRKSWYYGSEWTIYDCQRIDGHPLWWRCVMLIGGSI